MKLLIAGSRSIDANKLFGLMDINSLLDMFNLPWPTEFVHGGASRGGDRYADLVADSYHDTTPKKVFDANWTKHGRSAGMIRNKEMADYSDVLILIWDGESRGSANMKKNMEDLNKPVFEIIFKGKK